MVNPPTQWPTGVVQTPTAECAAALADPNGVLVIGDSLSVIGFDDITTLFPAAGHPVCVNAQSGRNTVTGFQVMASYFLSGVVGPDTTIVMALGTNDIPSATNVMRNMMETSIRYVGKGHQMFWVQPFCEYPFSPTITQAQYDAGTWRIGTEMQWVATHYANFHSVPWPDLVLSTNYPSLLNSDLTHPTAAGSVLRTTQILNTIAGH